MKQKDRNKPCAETWINGLYEDKDLILNDSEDFCHGFDCKVKDRCDKYQSADILPRLKPVGF